MSSVDELEEQIKSHGYDREEPFVFVSYSKKDADKVYPIVNDLQMRHVNLWIDLKGLEATAGTSWTGHALDALADANCKALIFFMSVNSFLSAPVCAEIMYTKAGVVNLIHDGDLRVIPYSLNPPKNMGAYIDEIDREYNKERVKKEDLEKFRQGFDDGKFPNIKGGKQNIIARTVYKLRFGGDRETTVAFDFDELLENIKGFIDVDMKDDSKENSEPETHKVSSREAHVSTEQSQGKFSANDMRKAFEEMLTSHPDKVEQAVDALPCLMYWEDYQADQLHEGRTKNTFGSNAYHFESGGRKIAIGTNYSKEQKLQYYDELKQICEEHATQEIVNAPMATNNSLNVDNKSDNSSQVRVFGEPCDSSNQSDQMVFIFNKVLERHPDKVSALISDESMNVLSEDDYLNYKEGSRHKGFIHDKKTGKLGSGEKLNVGNAYVGKNLSLDDKKKYVRKLLQFCGEDEGIVEGFFNQESKSKGRRKSDESEGLPV